jgi:hypothetical protein
MSTLVLLVVDVSFCETAWVDVGSTFPIYMYPILAMCIA